MVERNECFSHLKAGYLFPEVAKRRREYSLSHPTAKVISLGIGNTTEPLTPYIASAMEAKVRSLATKEGYSGYGADYGDDPLREAIARTMYPNLGIDSSDIYISDGAKCDIARLQILFGNRVKVAVQDPAYPVYVDGSVLVGASGKAIDSGYKGISYIPCLPENDFMGPLDNIAPSSLIYFCSPNNPTGAAATRSQLKTLVDYALAHGCIIIYDAAYSAFIRDDSLPRSIYEIKGATNCAIETQSFSKPAGFTGVRLGWSVVPKGLRFSSGYQVASDWGRLMTTLFNGASNIAQAGGLAALSPQGLKEMRGLTDYYLENAHLIEEALLGDNFKTTIGTKVYFTGNAPYLWVKFPGYKSWDIFDKLLNKCQVVTTPGSGFGPSGESFIRFSSFGHREDIKEACQRLKTFSL